MKREENEMIEALQMKIQAMGIKNEALQLRIEALEIKNRTLEDRGGSYSQDSKLGEIPALSGKENERRLDSAKINQMKEPMNNQLKKILKDGNYNKATYRAISGILLAMWENGTANVSLLNEYIGGARVTIVRHTGMLKKLGLMVYEGSRKKGHYALTEKGKQLLAKVEAAAGLN